MSSDIISLISLKILSGRSPTIYKQAFSGVDAQILKASSIYKVRHFKNRFQSIRSIKGDEIFDGYSCVLMISPNTGAQELLENLKRIEGAGSPSGQQKVISANCLVYGDERQRTPRLTLPHPEFHLNPEEIVPAAEVWPEHQHVVLNKSLSQLAKSFHGTNWGEYYGSAKEYL